MDVVNIHEAKTNLSRLVAKAAAGRPFVIARAGKPLVKVVPYETADKPKRIGFLEGQAVVRAEIKDIGREEVLALFEGEQ